MKQCQLLYGVDVLEGLRELDSDSVSCVVTSPPYWGIRDYKCDGQIGLESTYQAYVGRMVEVFREVRRVLSPEGTLWLNLGDSYHNGDKGGYKRRVGPATSILQEGANFAGAPHRSPQAGLKPKDLCGIPWRVAFALQDDGWWLRSDIIWHKPNPMPESVRDRPTKSHEYVFLMSKSECYYYDQEAIAEAIVTADEVKYAGTGNGLHSGESHFGSGTSTRRYKRASLKDLPEGQANIREARTISRSGNKARKPGVDRGCPEGSGSNVCGSVPWEGYTRNKRTVWTIPTQPFSGAHFATFPLELPITCIKGGSPAGGLILDPFSGTATTGEAAIGLGRRFVGIDLNKEYLQLAKDRLGLFAI